MLFTSMLKLFCSKGMNEWSLNVSIEVNGELPPDV